MRTIDRLSSTAAYSWLRGGASRLRRAMMARRPAVRLGLVLAPVLALAAAGYWAAGTLTPAGPRYLAAGRSFCSEDLITICRNFDAKGISYRVDEGKVEVESDQFDQAVAAFAKLDVGLRPFNEIREAPPSLAGILETHEDKEQRERHRREKMIERFIDPLDGVVWSLVSLRYPKAGLSRAARARPTAFVYLESESDRPLPPQTVRAIPAILLSNEPELSLEAITMIDRKGHPYLDSRNPALGKLTRDWAREQELRDRVADRLKWIKGIQIFVELTDRREGDPSAVARALPAAAEHRATHAGEPSTSIAVNQPAAIGAPAPSPDPAAVEKAERGGIHVFVPRSYYFNGMYPRPDHREPTVEELRELAARTKELVERMVKPLIPESWTLDVGTIPDEVPMTRPAALPAGSDYRRIATDWGIVGAVVAAVAVLMAMGSWIQAARRPVREMAPAGGRRYREDSPDEPEPSERVRELVRRDPEAAASVLQRWATQGGRVS